MPYKEPSIEKVYYTISEVADLFQVQPSLIRYWESRFPNLKPKKSPGGRRHYTQADINEIRLVYYLVKEKGMTLSGAQQKLKENKSDTEHNHEIVKKLQDIRELLAGMYDEL
ncbi:MAG: MerR family transcriptional regulator [Bacteroidales bacterium]